MFCALTVIHYCIFRDEDPEKLSKSEDASAADVSAQEATTMPHVPITTPPPPVMGTDMSTGYGAYNNWYQVRTVDVKLLGF